MRDELGEAAVGPGQWLPQDGVQASEEAHSIQQVEGEAAGEGQQVAGGGDGRRGRVRHHVAVHRAAERRCGPNAHSVRELGARYCCGASRGSAGSPAARRARSPLGQVTRMSDTMVVKAHSGQWSLVGHKAEVG